MASAGMHGFLALLLVFGSAFFVSKEKPIAYPKLQFVPSTFVESALARGGGNPNIARTDDVQKGSPDAPKQLIDPPKQPERRVQATPPPPAPDPQPPKPEVKRQEKKVVEPKREPTKKVAPKVTEVAKPKVVEKPAPPKPRIDLSDLKPVTRSAEDKRKAQEEAEAREAARQEAIAVAKANAARQRLADKFRSTATDLQRGFEGGTKVDVGGPGGEAYANYGAFVQQAYQEAWQSQTRLFNELNDDDFVAVVEVVITRDGRVVRARITDRSPSNVMNRCVQRALDAVKKLPPFPAFITDSERSFTIEFNLKTSRTTG